MSQDARRLRVLHVIPSVSAKRGGPSTAIRNLTAGLAAAGVAVTVATTDDDGEDRSPETVQGFHSGVKVECFARTSHFYTVSLGLHQWLAGHTGGFSVVHIHSLFSFPALAAARAAQRTGVPYVVRPLGTLNRWGMKRRRPILKRLSFELVEKAILRRAAWVHFSSEQERAEAEELGRFAPARVIPNPVEYVAEGPASQGPPRILTLGRIDPVKNLDQLLQAFAGLRRAQPELTLEIAGAGDAHLTETLRRQSQALGLRDSVIWSGPVSGAQKAAAFGRAAVFVLASQSENFGLAAVEAMARGIPVVVTSGVGVSNDVARANAGVVCEPAAASLEPAIREVLLAPGNRGMAARALVREKFSMGAVAATLVKEYQALAG